ncbi:helicase-associated domain-containing protein [Streptomyces sp. CB02923]|uniref:helicase-associated domain-containing protein n=1 Tax=Streptomyces sp. CB02923 TaxID=1718985 RepID=UPI0009A0FD6A|nr:helicase-associated domain-containing protein [Streptomyces sp. CB02923]
MEGLDTLTRSLAQRAPEELAALLTRHAEPLSRRPAPTRLRELAGALWSYETLHHTVLHLDHPRLHLLAATARISQELARGAAPAPAAPAAGADYQSLMAHRLSFPDLATEPVPADDAYQALGAAIPGPARDAVTAALNLLYADGLAAPTEDGAIVVPPRTPQLLAAHDLGAFTPVAPRFPAPRTPESGTPESGTSESGRPESAAPETDGSGPAAPGSAAPEPPAPEVAASAAAVLRGESQAAASALAAALDRLLAALAAQPAALRKSGGLALREIKRLAKAADTTEARTRLLLDLVLAAGLIALTRTPAGITAVPTEAYDAWLAQTPGERLVPVLTAWAALWAIPTYTPFGETPTALVRGEDRHAPALRHALLKALATASADAAPSRLPVGTSFTSRGAERSPFRGAEASPHRPDLPALLEAAAWHRPLAVVGEPLAEDRAAHILDESAFLALTAHGSLTSLGHALFSATPASPDALGAALRDLLPPPVQQAHFQADLTAVVPGPPSAALAGLLSAAADRESEGHAVTWRFTPASVRRALDAGHGADGLIAALAEVSAAGPLPQPLTYLVQDAARSHGRMRVLPTACCIRSDDEALIRELAAHRTLRPLGLRVLAPTVLASAQPPAATLEALRGAGYAPALESESGTASVERRPGHRTRTGPSGTATTPLDLARRLLAG